MSTDQGTTPPRASSGAERASVPRRVRVPKASDVLANELRAQIFEQNLEVGDPLPSETELIEKHNFSRGTVREALRLLEADGFVSIQRGPKGGISVRYPDEALVSRSLATLVTVDQSPLSDLFEFRKLIEPAAAAQAAEEATDEQRQTLLAMTQDSSPDRGDAKFHTFLGECTHNEIFRVMLAALKRVIEWHAGMVTVSDHDFERTGDVHARIAAAVAAGNADKAQSLMLKHLVAFEDVMRRQGRLDEPILPREQWVRHLREDVYQR